MGAIGTAVFSVMLLEVVLPLLITHEKPNWKKIARDVAITAAITIATPAEASVGLGVAAVAAEDTANYMRRTGSIVRYGTPYGTPDRGIPPLLEERARMLWNPAGDLILQLQETPSDER
jgi:hypothetical protein